MKEDFLYNHVDERFPRKDSSQLELWKQKEREFLSRLPKQRSSKESDGVMRDWQHRLEDARAREAFYREAAAVDYDFQLKYRQARSISMRLPIMMENYEAQQEQLKLLEAKKGAVDASEEAAKRQEAEALKKQADATFQAEKVRLKDLRKRHIISEKAFSNSMKMAKGEKRHQYEQARLMIPSTYYEEEIKFLKHRIDYDRKRQERNLQDELADLLKRIPVQRKKGPIWHAFVGLPIPGLAQLLNGQPVKAIFFFIGTLFNYLIAIPYALGYGNYQGKGLFGLVTLAVGGRRLDKSIMFMIEGIIAMFLLVGALLIFYLAFRDGYKTQRESMRGKRPYSWFLTRKSIVEEGFPYTVTLPSLILTVFIVLVPIATTILLSFAGQDPNHQSKFGWVGFQNYMLLIQGKGLAGSLFWKILGWTLIWTLGASTLAIVTGFMLALLLNNERIRGKLIYRIIYILPWAVPSFITIMLFSIMVSPNSFITTLLAKVMGETILIKNNAMLTRITLILLQTWLGSSYIFLLSTGVLQSIPGDLYEAAVIDGASAWQKLTRITLPLVLFQTAPLLIGQYTFNFNNFTIIWLFNGGGPFDPVNYGNLAGASDILISYVFKLTIENQYQSIGAAIAVFISLALMLVTFVGYYRSKAFKEL